MRLKRFLQEYRAAWRTVMYFAFFWFVLGVFSIPLQLLSLLDDERYSLVSTAIFGACFLMYLPFAILWASRISGVRPPTEEQADQLHQQAVAAKNAELRKETPSAGSQPSSSEA